MRKILIAVLIVLSGCPLFAAERFTAVFPGNYPPYYNKENGITSGFGLELLSALFRRMDIDVNFVAVPNRADAYEMLESGRAQILPDAYVNPRMTNSVLYTVSFDSSPIALITKQNRYDINNEDDLLYKKVAYQQNIVLANIKNHGRMELHTAENATELIFQLLSGRADAIVYPLDHLMQTARTLGAESKLKVLTPYIYDSVRAIGVSKDYPALYLRINDTLKEFMKTREYADLYRKWHGEPVPFWNSGRLATVFLVVLIATVTGLSVWRMISLRRKNTELKAAKTELEKSEAMFLALAESSNEILIFASPDLREVHFVSMSYEKICGRSVTSFKLNPLSFRDCVHPNDLHKLKDDSLIIREGEQNPKMRITNCITGNTRWVVLRSSVFRRTDDPLLAIVISDITDITQAQQDKAAQELVLIEQAKYVSMGEMVRAISHQWRQPLNSLYLCLQLMEEHMNDKSAMDIPMTEYLATSCELVEHMTDTISDFRSFFKKDSGEEFFDASETVLNTVRMIEPQLKSYKIRFNIRCSCERDSFELSNKVENKSHGCCHQVKGYRNEFKHAVINIIQNAKDELLKNNTDMKEIDIVMGCSGTFTLHITDNGGGISDENLEQIFRSDFTMKKGGTGLGLHLTRQIIEKMEGKVWAEPSHAGARFTISLPAQKVSMH